MDVRVKVVHLFVLSVGEEREVNGGGASGREVLDGVGPSSADDNHRAVGENLVRGVPPAFSQSHVITLDPVAGFRRVTGFELPDLPEPVKVSTCLKKRSVGEELAGRTPGVGQDHQGTELVCGEIEEGGVSIAVAFQDGVVWVVPAATLRQKFPRRTDVGPVEEDDGVEARDGRVHGGYSGV